MLSLRHTKQAIWTAAMPYGLFFTTQGLSPICPYCSPGREKALVTQVIGEERAVQTGNVS